MSAGRQFRLVSKTNRQFDLSGDTTKWSDNGNPQLVSPFQQSIFLVFNVKGERWIIAAYAHDAEPFVSPSLSMAAPGSTE